MTNSPREELIKIIEDVTYEQYLNHKPTSPITIADAILAAGWKPAKQWTAEEIRDAAVDAMNNEQVRNGITLPTHKFSEICSCGRCHTATYIAKAIADLVNGGKNA